MTATALLCRVREERGPRGTLRVVHVAPPATAPPCHATPFALPAPTALADRLRREPSPAVR